MAVDHAATLYTITASRGHGVFVRVLGPKYPGVLHADRFLAYEDHSVAGWVQQKCLAHLLKDRSELSERGSHLTREHAAQLTQLLRDALALHRSRNAPSAAADVNQLGERLDVLIALLRHRARLLVFPQDRRV